MFKPLAVLNLQGWGNQEHTGAVTGELKKEWLAHPAVYKRAYAALIVQYCGDSATLGYSEG